MRPLSPSPPLLPPTSMLMSTLQRAQVTSRINAPNSYCLQPKEWTQSFCCHWHVIFSLRTPFIIISGILNTSVFRVVHVFLAFFWFYIDSNCQHATATLPTGSDNKSHSWISESRVRWDWRQCTDVVLYRRHNSCGMFKILYNRSWS